MGVQQGPTNWARGAAQVRYNGQNGVLNVQVERQRKFPGTAVTIDSKGIRAGMNCGVTEGVVRSCGRSGTIKSREGAEGNGTGKRKQVQCGNCMFGMAGRQGRTVGPNVGNVPATRERA